METKKMRPRKPPVVTLVGLVVLISWILILLLTGIGGTPEPSFVDYMHDRADVSSQYEITYPITRYLLEPVSGLTFLVSGLGIFDATSTFVLLYAVSRLIYLLVTRIFLRGSRKLRALQPLARNVVNFFWKYFLLALGIGSLEVLVGYLALGFLYVNHTFLGHLKALAFFGTGILAIKIIQSGIVFFKRGAVLGIRPPKPWMKLQDRKSREYRLAKTTSVIAREARYGTSIFLMFLALSMTFSSIHLPTRTINTTLASNEILADFHVHTHYSDGWLSPEDRVDWYIEQGIRVAAFSDHQRTEGAKRAREYVERNNLDFLVITAQEYTTYNIPGEDKAIHLNIFGIDEDITAKEFENDSWASNPMNVSEMIQYVKARGGFVIVNHYRTPPGEPYTFDELVAWGVDGFECSTRRPEILQYCREHGLASVFTSDMHTNEPTREFTRLTLADPSNLTLAAIFEATRQNTTQGILIRDGLRVSLPGWLDEFGLLEDALEYVLNMDPWQRLSWIAWSSGIFLAIAIMESRVKKLPLEIIEGKTRVDPRKKSFLARFSRRSR